ncbi:MAG: hypothetical protein WCP97_00620 [bacterium]
MFSELYEHNSVILGVRFNLFKGLALFQDGVTYNPDEIQVLKGKTEQVKRTVHNVKKILVNGNKTPIVKG